MKAIVYTQHGLAADNPQSLFETQLPKPEPGPRDLLVKIRAIAVNPVDTKVRAGSPTDKPRVLGWDAVGTVEAVGADVSMFKPGDDVFYAGSIARPGAYAEYGLVDERIAGRKPSSLSDADAAALPLTSLTAWELLFDRLGVTEGGGAGDALLIVGAAGGVGSMLTQLASQLTKLRVIGTASRPETRAWVEALGAHDVIDHSRPLLEGLRALGVPSVRYVASLTQTDSHYPQIVEALAPQGRLGVIDDPDTLDAVPLKRKAVSLHWELMFTRSLFETPDMIRQHEILERVAALIDAGTLRTTTGEHFGRIDADNLRRAHALIESGRSRGKIVLEGF
ncbi:zinc-binding alcohol dehydrogenase family protein [Paraburkholderia caballeronis]|uniref:Zinc-type alcohol dehydrogenase-like protein n=1 Tax=Paraburkholderia caballeronis TaxID=416943 RepID=A0A1H7P5S3_9BURK|nr:zinc-binding alcohol dehydrogenase family protein [Paraburkholderia caballeronis]PXW25366.1 zinc-binding alcohol dehydrogenase family protein [Paraburkholderia caballeronis]PXX00973.1 zinc-binding alcohol dehydrogenase family protein [Paraburkholderia caballeronis]RAJ99674.1 zinc-binding alcohol dehydrogenase family protein [Paraburkholderia caballeronis]SEE40288.1 zinc-binding alcohol dehydrogenase family protein [Paraburkholderia caballeronis]SEL31210.1 zinc-binding alcohol dehydrogenase 